jgi:hypothetical protein
VSRSSSRPVTGVFTARKKASFRSRRIVHPGPAVPPFSAGGSGGTRGAQDQRGAGILLESKGGD